MNAAPMFPNEVVGLESRSGLAYLRDACAEYFESYSVPATVSPVGLRFRSFAIATNAPGGGSRVVFIPGFFDGDQRPKPRPYGVLSREGRNHSSVVNPRELLSWERPFTLSVWCAPPSGRNTHDEGAATLAAEDLVTQVVRALHEAGASDITWGEIDIIAPPVENGFGVELLVHATQRGPIFDVTREIAFAQPAVPAKKVETS